MKLPAAVLDTRARYVAAFPLWVMPPGPEAEERARQWNLGLVAQVVFEHGPSYGAKRSSSTNPISKDTLARMVGADLIGWDMLTGTGTGAPKLTDNPDSADLTGQHFEYVAPRDVIGHGQAPPTTPPTQPPSSHIPYNEGYSVQFGLGCNEVYAASGAPFDPGMIAVHASRAAWDYYVGGLTWDASYKKHINEFRAEYGLPPV